MMHKQTHDVLAIGVEKANLQVLESCLDGEDIAVESAPSGEAALSLLAETRFDLVLLDVTALTAKGEDVLGAIRANWPADELPVLVLAEPSERDAASAALSAGANDYLDKPLDAATARARLQTQLGLAEIAQRLKRTSRALQEQTNHLRVVMDSATIAIFALDLHECFTSANQMTAEIAGSAVADLIGTPFAELIEPGERQEVEELLAKVIDDGYFVTDHEVELRRPDGSRRTVILSFRALTVDDHVAGVAGIANDVTDLWRQRKQLTAYIESLLAPDPELLDVLAVAAPDAKVEAGGQLDVAVAKGSPRAAAEVGKLEHRRQDRHKVYKGAKLVFNNGASVMNCIVRDLSDTGARLQFETHFDCPRLVVLRLPDGTSYNCEVRRFAHTIMGLRFLGKHW